MKPNIIAGSLLAQNIPSDYPMFSFRYTQSLLTPKGNRRKSRHGRSKARWGKKA